MNPLLLQVSDEQGQPLQGVLLSLSGGDNYRSNSLSLADGKKSFLNLVSSSVSNAISFSSRVSRRRSFNIVMLILRVWSSLDWTIYFI